MSEKEINTNQKTWDAVASRYFGRTALPDWGEFSIGQNDESLIGDIEGHVFLEIACGSGHSIDYLIQHGASKAFGIDFSSTQIEMAKKINAEAMQQGKVSFYQKPMEDFVELSQAVDTVFSIYGLGWTTDIDSVLRNVNTYLKLNGRFIWSWEHPFYPNVEYKNDEYVITRSYHDEELQQEDWGAATGRYISTRKISTWYNSLRKHGFDIEQMLEPPPVTFTEEQQNPAKYYSAPRAKLVPPTMIFVCKKVTETE